MRWKIAITAATLAISLLVPVAVLAADTGTCAETNFVNRWEGFLKSLPSMAGAEATLENQSLNICSSSTDGSRANHVYVALDDGGAHAFNIFQAGLVNCVDTFLPNASCNNNGTHEFWAWGRQSCPGLADVAPNPKFMGAFPGSSRTYTVLKTSTQWQVKVSGTVTETLPLASICWAPKRTEHTGESWDIRDAIGGPVGNPFRLSNATYEASVGGAWSNMNWGTGGICNLSSDARYKCNAPTGTSIDLWTVQP
ncbi:MAG: hypothetical protein V4515_06515 [Chloroflexota bacterium]